MDWRSWTWIYLVAFIAIIITLLTPFLIFGQEYGTWETVEGECKRNGEFCKSGGSKTSLEVCIPNPVNGYGCLRNGRQTFETTIHTESCEVVCRKSIWKDTTGQCVDSKMITERKCVQHDPKGNNYCFRTELIDGYSDMVYYNIGDSYETVQPCTSEIEQDGQWILLPQNKYSTYPRNKVLFNPQPSSTNVGNELFKFSPNCNTSEILGEGLTRDIYACYNNGKMYIPKDQNNPTSPLCSSTPDLDSYVHCRYLPSGLQYFTIQVGDNYIGMRNLPSNERQIYPFTTKGSDARTELPPTQLELIKINFFRQLV